MIEKKCKEVEFLKFKNVWEMIINTHMRKKDPKNNSNENGKNNQNNNGVED